MLFLRNSKALFDSKGHKYGIKRKSLDGKKITWRCTVRWEKENCPGIVKEENGVYRETIKHTCQEKKDVHVQARVYSKCKEEIRKNRHAVPRKVSEPALLEEFLDDEEAELPKLSNLNRALYKIKEATRPANPADLHFDMKRYVQAIPKQFLRGDIKVNTRNTLARHLIFATDKQLKLLKTLKKWFADGTFKCTPFPFVQLFSIHGFIEKKGFKKQVPLLYVIMSRRTAEDYSAVFDHILQLIGHPEAIEFVADFEKAVWKTVRAKLPSVTIRGCGYHWTQSLFRFIQQNGLRRAYRTDQEVRNKCRQLMSLHLMPHEKIEKRFKSIQRTCRGKMKKFCSYIDRNWIKSHTWPPVNWSVFRQDDRTNNDVEGWHNRINEGKNGAFNLFHLIDQLHYEATLISLQAKLMERGENLRRRNKACQQLQDDLVALWDQYTNDDLPSKLLLEKVATLYDIYNKAGNHFQIVDDSESDVSSD
jgi:hypothetical protein